MGRGGQQNAGVSGRATAKGIEERASDRMSICV